MTMAHLGLLVDRHRNLTITGDPVRVLQHAYPRTMCDKGQDLGAMK
jgi:hypothetical protein